MTEGVDEVRSGHRLYDKGLNRLLWIGTVAKSELIQMLERQNSVQPHHNPARFANLVHYVLPLRGAVVEVVADSISVRRIAGTLLSAAVEAMSTQQ